MTTGQIPVAASSSTVTSSKPLAGSGAGITTGPTTTTNGDCVEFAGTAGQIADSGSACGGGGGGGISYPTGDLTIVMASRGIVSYSCQVGAQSFDTIASSTVTGTGPFTLTANVSSANQQTVNNVLTLSGYTGGYSALNGQVVKVLTAPTASQYTVNVTGVTAGTSGTGADSCTYAFPSQLLRQPAMANFTLINNTQGGLNLATVAASPSTYLPDRHWAELNTTPTSCWEIKTAMQVPAR